MVSGLHRQRCVNYVRGKLGTTEISVRKKLSMPRISLKISLKARRPFSFLMNR